jgi:hypothetical protein
MRLQDQDELKSEAPHSLKVREENMMRQRARVFTFFLLASIGAATPWAQAADLSVNCAKHDSVSKVLRLLARLIRKGPTPSLFRAIAEKTS